MSDLILSILTSISGSTLLLGLFGWLGKRHLDKALQNERQKHQAELAHLQRRISKDLELHKHQLKYDERFFDLLFKASMELFKIRQTVLPDRTHPDMEWADALEIICSNFGKIEKDLTEFIEKYYTALPPDIFEPLNSIIINCSDGKFAQDPNQEMQIADEVYRSVDNVCKELKSLVDEKRKVEIPTSFKE